MFSFWAHNRWRLGDCYQAVNTHCVGLLMEYLALLLSSPLLPTGTKLLHRDQVGTRTADGRFSITSIHTCIPLRGQVQCGIWTLHHNRAFFFCLQWYGREQKKNKHPHKSRTTIFLKSRIEYIHSVGSLMPLLLLVEFSFMWGENGNLPVPVELLGLLPLWLCTQRLSAPEG